MIEPGKYTLKQLNEGAWVLMKYRNAWFVSAYSGAAILWISYFAARTGFGSRSWQWFLSFFVCLLLLAICSWKAYSNEPAIRALVSLGCSAVIFVVVNLILPLGAPGSHIHWACYLQSSPFMWDCNNCAGERSLMSALWQLARTRSKSRVNFWISSMRNRKCLLGSPVQVGWVRRHGHCKMTVTLWA